VQDYYLKEKDFYVNNFVPGIAYNYSNNSGLWFQPFLGGHYQNSTYYTSWNGYMTGWVFNYNFTFQGLDMVLSQ